MRGGRGAVVGDLAGGGTGSLGDEKEDEKGDWRLMNTHTMGDIGV